MFGRVAAPLPAVERCESIGCKLLGFVARETAAAKAVARGDRHALVLVPVPSRDCAAE